MKYIREARFGAPKCYKTGAILATYPKPMLVLMYDSGGHEIEKTIPMDVVRTLPVEIKAPITVLDLSFKATDDLSTDYTPAKDKDVFDFTVKTINQLRKLTPFPFKTVVVDPVTELSNAIWRHQAVANSSALADPRKWAGNIGMKVQQIIDYIHSLPCNTVHIFHEEVNKDENTKQISRQPMVYSNFRNFVGGKFTQFFHQYTNGRDTKLHVKSFDIVEGIGCRWPDFGQSETCGVNFQDIYGKEKDVFQ
jgi:hypothetical protein